VGVFLYAFWRGWEAPTRAVLGGIGLAFAGVLVLLLGRGLAAAASPALGDLIIFCALIAWVVYTAEGKAFIAEYGWFRATAWTLLAGAVMSAPFAPWCMDWKSLVHAGGTTWFCLFYVGIMTSVVSYFLWYFAIGRMDASKVAVYSNLQPVFTALAARALLGEALTWEIGVGGALVILGVRIAQKPRLRGPSAADSPHLEPESGRVPASSFDPASADAASRRLR